MRKRSRNDSSVEVGEDDHIEKKEKESGRGGSRGKRLGFHKKGRMGRE